MMVDKFESSQTSLNSPAEDLVLVTPADSDLTTALRGFIVGTSGAVSVRTVQGNDVTIPANCIVAGQTYPIRCIRVNATGTTASEIVGII